ncbi:hypothetical protein YIM_29500 [Amycolatopsis sp. YIM 10]|nr:hypothetical protein YIM_29500 [Amycolatopsis sp. YIM 10]
MHAEWAGRARGLDSLLEYARARIRYYRELPPGGLGAFPVTDRAAHLTRPDDFRPSPDKCVRELTSSGTSGVPLRISVDDAAWYGVNYHFFAQLAQRAGLGVGEFEPGKPAVLFVSNKLGRESFVRPLPSLNSSLYARVQLGSVADVARLYERLRAPILYGKPTYLLDLRAALLDQGRSRPPWSPRLVLVSGEPLHADDRARLTGFFGAPVVDALASSEGGLIAATAPGSGRYEVFGENVRLEVRADDGTLAESGVGELVVTNLLYRGTVFVRYRTGDRAELVTDGTGRQFLAELWGREPEVVRLAGADVAADVVTARIGFLPGLLDFQLVTGEEPAVLRWTPDVAADEAVLVNALAAAMADLAPGEPVVLQRCERITPLGGKKRRFG